MNTANGITLVLVITLGGLACPAQDAPIPFGQIGRDVRMSATMTLPGNGSADSFLSSSLSPGSSLAEPLSAGFTRMAPIAAHRTLGASFFLLNASHLGAAVLDVEMTHRCIESHHCREGNPLMPSALAGALSVNFALVGYGTYVTYRLKKHQARKWWISPVIGTAAHVAGAVTGIVHQ